MLRGVLAAPAILTKAAVQFSLTAVRKAPAAMGSASSIVPLGVRRLPTPPGREYSLKRVGAAASSLFTRMVSSMLLLRGVI